MRFPSLQRALFFTLGTLALALGVAGIFLPLLPTTPFLLLAAFCFSRSSARFHHWLLHHHALGPPIRNWQQHGVIPPRAKAIAFLALLLSGGIMATQPQVPLAAKLVATLVLGTAALFIATRPNRPRG